MRGINDRYRISLLIRTLVKLVLITGLSTHQASCYCNFRRTASTFICILPHAASRATRPSWEASGKLRYSGRKCWYVFVPTQASCRNASYGLSSLYSKCFGSVVSTDAAATGVSLSLSCLVISRVPVLLHSESYGRPVICHFPGSTSLLSQEPVSLSVQ
jgi:hypothetical protein